MIIMLLLAIALKASFMCAKNILTMQPIKDPVSMSLTSAFLKNIHDVFKIDTFVETGTAYGGTTAAACQYFANIYTVELDDVLYAACAKRFLRQSAVKLYHGTSSTFLKQIRPLLKGKGVVFFLDGHNSPSMAPGDVNCPLIEELNLISSMNVSECVILIDDIRCCFWKKNNWEQLKKCHGDQIKGLYETIGYGWPSFDEVITVLKRINPYFKFGLFGDLLIAYEPKKTIHVASELEAFFDSLHAQDVANVKLALGSESIIEEALGGVFDCIKEYVTNLSIFEHSVYHPQLHVWYGLMLFKRKRYEEALHQLDAARLGGMSGWRVDWYRARTYFAHGKLPEARQIMDEIDLEAYQFEPCARLKRRIDGVFKPR